MQKYGYRGVVFVPTGILTGEITTARIDDAPYMHLGHLKELYDAGWEIGSHTVTHRRLDLLPLIDVSKEYGESREQLRAWGFDPVSLAYPYGHGHYTEDQRRLTLNYYFWARTVGDEHKPNQPPYQRDLLHGIPSHQDIGIDYGEGWYVFVIHVITDIPKFRQWLDTIQVQETDVVTLEQVKERWKG